MGTDIHGQFQRKSGHQWISLSDGLTCGDRDYLLFAVLADVRNDISCHVEPIAHPRGFPDDYVFPDDDEHWIDETHSKGWLSGEEMLKWFENAPTITRTGVLSKAEFEAWDKVSKPESWCQWVGGNNVVLVDQRKLKNNPQANFVQVCWQEDLKTSLAYFFDEVRDLQQTHTEIRFVFCFDC